MKLPAWFIVLFVVVAIGACCAGVVIYAPSVVAYFNPPSMGWPVTVPIPHPYPRRINKEHRCARI